VQVVDLRVVAEQAAVLHGIQQALVQVVQVASPAIRWMNIDEHRKATLERAYPARGEECLHPAPIDAAVAAQERPVPDPPPDPVRGGRHRQFQFHIEVSWR
jgi:hypothetical protein